MRTPLFPPLALTASLLALAACGGETTPQAQGDAPARVVTPLPAAYQNLDLAPGANEGRKCALCHTFTAGAPHSVGPNLHHVFGTTVGTVPGFAFSPALQNADFVWTPEALEEWLTNPNGFLPGTRMTFPGVYDDNIRHSLIAWLYAETGGGDGD